MTVLVTGASGLIGGAVARRLRAEGRPVRLAGRTPEQLRAAWGEGAAIVALPAPDAADVAFDRLVDRVTTVVHCAALNSDASSASLSDFRNANAVLPARIATALLRAGGGHFVYMSSIRAVAGPGVASVVSPVTEPLPTCDYGRSKLDGERSLIEALAGQQDHPLTILRLAPVYGHPLSGNLRLIARLADTPVPLPVGSISAPRSLLSLDALVDAVILLLDGRPSTSLRTFVVSDGCGITLPEIVSAMREGLGRPRRVLAVPPALVAAALRALGKQELWRNLAAAQLCDPSALEAIGWTAPLDTPARLSTLVRRKTYAA